MIKVCTSGYYNPVHKGHLKLLEEASKLGDWLVVIVNNDEQVKLKGSKVFMDEEERCDIMRAIRYVDEVVLSIDKDRTVRLTLDMIKPNIFVKGGDSTPENVPEKDVCDKNGTTILFDIGGDKIQSSSWLKESY
jgi:D-beta-D-heptose 7-phosphate kinase/D-beta-D-heptose 1-phosphate adenosyltransferase